MATMNVSLPDAMKAWVDRQAESGRYSNASDYIRDLIRHDQERQEALRDLQDAVNEGIESGEARSFDFEQFLKRKRKEHDIE